MASKRKKRSGVVPRGSVVAVEINEPRIVTPDNPLNITSTPASFDQVFIQGGDINVTIQAEVTFQQLKKVS